MKFHKTWASNGDFLVDAGEIKTIVGNVSFSHPNTTVETDLDEHIKLTELDYHTLDFSNLTQITTIRVYEKTDGINYRLLSQRVFPDDYDTGVETIIVILNGGGQDMKITLQSAVAEGSAKSIPGTIRNDIR